MSDFSIGLSGMEVALRALETVGNNISNASTEGFHRQEVSLAPMPETSGSGHSVGGGAEVVDIRRIVDSVLENELFRQQPSLCQVQEELGTLQTIESMLGDLSSQGLGEAVNRFFNSLTAMAADPQNSALRDQVIWSGDNLASQMRNLSTGLTSLGQSIEIEAANVVDQINTTAGEVAELNQQVSELYYRGSPDNNLTDRRDAAVMRLAGLLDVQTQPSAGNTVTVRAGGTCIVIRGKTTALEAGHTTTGELGVSVAGANYYDTQISGGRLGALMALKNQILPGLGNSLNTMAREIAQRVNDIHVQGIGAAGSFDRLTGRIVEDDLSAWAPPLQAGTAYVRVIDTATGVATRHAVTVDPTSVNPSFSTLAGVAAQFDSIGGLSATVIGSRLHIEADNGYQFDFLPALLPDPNTSTLSGSARPTISGAYTGDANQTYTARVVGTGQVGVTPDLAVEITDGGGNPVTVLNIGLGYAAGDPLEVPGGIQVSMSTGTLNDGETFTIEALADSDTSGLLAGAGINTFFEGNSAASLRVSPDIAAEPNRLAIALGASGTDNTNVRRMAALGQAPIDALGGVTLGDHFRRLQADVGQQITSRQARQEAIQGAVQQLTAQRDRISGVDLNEEAAKLLVFEQLFQGMAKYITTVQKTNEYLMEVLGV